MKKFYALIVCVLISFSCKNEETTYKWQTLEVTATAYNSLAYQTNSNPLITAFGDSLRPGQKYIAISRDLFSFGFKHNTPVIIEGLDSVYLVKDKMNKRWTKRIDIYMGNDVIAAKKWGKKKILIAYGIEKDSLDK
jgi:3D (Asp-Asp-Asp) domain-containing protein